MTFEEFLKSKGWVKYSKWLLFDGDGTCLASEGDVEWNTMRSQYEKLIRAKGKE